MMSERIAAMSDKVRNTQPTICLDLSLIHI